MTMCADRPATNIDRVSNGRGYLAYDGTTTQAPFSAAVSQDVEELYRKAFREDLPLVAGSYTSPASSQSPYHNFVPEESIDAIVARHKAHLNQRLSDNVAYVDVDVPVDYQGAIW